MIEWKPIETAPKGVEILLYEPEVTAKQKALNLRARVVIAIYPTHYPRKATHWAKINLPEPPK